MEPVVVPSPAVIPAVAAPVRPVIIRPPEVNSAHDFAVIAWVLTLLYVLPGLIIVGVIGAYGVLASPYLGYLILPPPPSALPFIGAYVNYLVFILTPSWFVYLAVGGFGVIIALIFLAIVYFGTVGNINRGRYEKARGWSLLLALLFIIPIFAVLAAPGVFFATVLLLLPAFFWFMTYGRLGEVVAKYGPVAILGEAAPAAPPPPPPVPAPAPQLPTVAIFPHPTPPPIAAVAPPISAIPAAPMPPPTMTPMPQAMPHAPQVPACPTCGRDLYYSANHRRWYCQTCDNPGS
jgi:hypothetical protein